MAWLESHQSLRDHPKTRRLARRMDGLAPAVGTLHLLWWWCLDYAKDGDLTKYDHEEIADACEWEGEPETIVKWLVECGFLDNGDGLRVHDWSDYGGQTISRKEADRERKRLARLAAVQRTSGGHPADGASTDRQTDIQTRGRTTSGKKPVDNSLPVDKKPICQCGGEFQYVGDGSQKMRCPVCERVKP